MNYSLLLLPVTPFGWTSDLSFNGDLLEFPHGDFRTADATTWPFDGAGDVDKMLGDVLSLIV